MKILLVEDDSQVRDLAATVLRDAGYRVIEARTGRDALTIATVMLTSVVAFVAFISGALFFRRVERRFADVV